MQARRCFHQQSIYCLRTQTFRSTDVHHLYNNNYRQYRSSVQAFRLHRMCMFLLPLFRSLYSRILSHSLQARRCFHQQSIYCLRTQTFRSTDVHHLYNNNYRQYRSSVQAFRLHRMCMFLLPLFRSLYSRILSHSLQARRCFHQQSIYCLRTQTFRSTDVHHLYNNNYRQYRSSVQAFRLHRMCMFLLPLFRSLYSRILSHSLQARRCFHQQSIYCLHTQTFRSTEVNRY